MSITQAQLKEAVTTSANSPWREYSNAKFLEEGDFTSCISLLPFRYSSEDACLENFFGRFTNRDFFADPKERVAVIIDSGGPHSIAMASKLVQEKGYQAIWKISNPIDPNGSVHTEQVVSSLKYYYPRFAEKKASSSAPPVFILNTHRTDVPATTKQKDTSTRYEAKDFPSVGELGKNRITKVLIIAEGPPTDFAMSKVDSSSLKSLSLLGSDGIRDALRTYVDQGVEVYRLRIDPALCQDKQKYY